MRYTRIALLTFGAGLVLGLVVVAFVVDLLARIASGLMVLGLLAIPVGLAADCWLKIRTLWPLSRRVARSASQRPAAARSRRPQRPRKPAARKR